MRELINPFGSTCVHHNYVKKRFLRRTTIQIDEYLVESCIKLR